MIDPRAGLRYAQALFGLAEKAGELERMEKELLEAKVLVERYPEISHLLKTTLSREEKEDFVEKVSLPEGFSNLLVNFLKVLVKKRRFQELALIQERFHRLYEQKKGLQRVRVESAVGLDEAVQEKLRRTLEKRLRRTVYLETAVDPEILGGLILDFDGTQIDGSFRTVIHELRQKLLAPTSLRGAA